MKNQIIFVPVFEQAGGSGNNGWFKIYGFAAFKITGWKFGGNGQAELNWNNTGAPGCTGNCRGIIGSFQKFIDLSPAYSIGGPDLGAKTVKLTKESPGTAVSSRPDHTVGDRPSWMVSRPCCPGPRSVP